MRRRIASLTLFALLPFGLTAGVNTIYLKDGRTFSGRFVNGDSGSVSFQDDQGQQYRFRTTEIQSIQFVNEERSNAQSGFGRFDNVDNRRPRTADGAPTAGSTIPVGTELSIRTIGTIDSRSSNDGQIFPATVDRDVLDTNGNVMIPRGANASLTIRSANGGSIRNNSDLLLDVQDVTVNGQRFIVNTEDLQRAGREGVGANRRTGEFVGGGTALGAIIGAIAGGGKGAAIGALAGAATGVGAEVVTKGSEVRIPSETVLTFRLDRPLTMNAANY